MSYIDAAEANDYFLTRLNSDAWFNEPDGTSSTPDRKVQALETATRAIDLLRYKGAKTDPDQLNQFPRNGETVIPVAIKLATAELALSFLEGLDPSMEYEAMSINSQTYANVRSSYDRTSLPEHIAAGVPSITAWRYLTPYLACFTNVKLTRVS